LPPLPTFESFVNDWEALLGAKIDVNIEKKNAFNTWSLKVIKDCEMILHTKFKVRVKDLLDLLLVNNILAMFYWVIQVFINYLKCEVLVMHV
jgi:hypothetical protein